MVASERKIMTNSNKWGGAGIDNFFFFFFFFIFFSTSMLLKLLLEG